MWQTKYASAVPKWELIFGRAVKVISSLGVRIPWPKCKKECGNEKYPACTLRWPKLYKIVYTTRKLILLSEKLASQRQSAVMSNEARYLNFL